MSTYPTLVAVPASDVLSVLALGEPCRRENCRITATRAVCLVEQVVLGQLELKPLRIGIHWYLLCEEHAKGIMPS